MIRPEHRSSTRCTRAPAAALIAVGVIVAGCTTSGPTANETNRIPAADVDDGATTTTSPALTPTPLYVPLDDHPTRLAIAQTTFPDPGPRLDGEMPGAPVRLAPDVTPAANQFWTSLIAEAGPSRLWLTPIAAEFSEQGLTIAQNDPIADDAGLVTPWSGHVRIEGDATGYEVTGYGDFSVSVAVDLAHDDGPASFDTTLAQGHPAVSMRDYRGPLTLRVLQDASLTTDGTSRQPGDDFSADTLTFDLEDGRWMVAADRSIEWTWNGAEVSAVLDGATLVVAPEPDDSSTEWPAFIELLASAPVSTTAAWATTSPGFVRQTLQWDGAGDIDRPVLLLPHQQTGETDGRVLGAFDTVYGTAQVIATRTAIWSAPLPGFLGAWPDIDVDEADLTRALALDDNLTEIRPTSYFGATDLARLTTAIDVLQATGVPTVGSPAEPTTTGSPAESGTNDSTSTTTGSPAADIDALSRLATTTIEDRLRWDGEDDESWITDDPDWNIPFAAQTEFKSELFNDRHFHQGYLLAAASSMAMHDPDLVDRIAPSVDMLASSLLGAGTTDLGHWDDAETELFVGGGLFNPYLGHSFADGLSLSNRGNNQESSSEAVNAWAGVARWGALTGRSGLEAAGLVRYAIESHTANAYWLRDGSVEQPSYAPSSTGIIWGDRAEYRTFFSAADEAIVGIQLIPFSPAALLRAVPTHRDATWSAVDADDRMWADLFVMERAQIDPSALDTVSTWLRADEPLADAQHGHSWVTRLGWTTMLADLGQVNDMAASPPIGRAFDSPAGVTLVASNLGTAPVQVEFTDAGQLVAILDVPARSTTTTLLPNE